MRKILFTAVLLILLVFALVRKGDNDFAVANDLLVSSLRENPLAQEVFGIEEVEATET